MVVNCICKWTTSIRNRIKLLILGHSILAYDSFAWLTGALYTTQVTIPTMVELMRREK